MKCKKKECKGNIDKHKGVFVSLGCSAMEKAHPCGNCGTLHYGNGDLVPGQK